MNDDNTQNDRPGLTGDLEGTILGSFKQKLIDTKEQWARDERGMSDEPQALKPKSKKPRLPPGQRRTQDFPVLDLGVQPAIAPDEWSLSVSGLVENPITWAWRDFQNQPQETFVSDIHCVTTWSRYDNTWAGVSGKHVLSVVRPKPEARHMVFHSHDGYTTNVPIKAFGDDDVILAHSWNGQPLSRSHGGPIRPIIPKLYFWKSAKWVKHITFLDKDVPGFWEVRGYHNNGDPWKEERYG